MVTLMSESEIRAALQDRHIPTLARLSGVSAQAIRRLRNGETRAVSFDVVQRLSNYFMGQQSTSGEASK